MRSAVMLKPGSCVLRRYRVDARPIQGGQAYVYSGTDTHTGGAVVIKQMATCSADARSQAQRERFETERRLRLGHLNVVDPLDSGIENDHCYIVFPRVGDMGLNEAHSRLGYELDVAQCLRILAQLASGLHAFHCAGYVHCDIKHDNVRLDSQTHHVWIIDAGTAVNFRDPRQRTHNKFNGTPLWCAPEQILSPASIDPRADIYALGGILYWLLTASLPISSANDPETQANLKRKQKPWPPQDLRPEIPQHTNDAILKALSPSPNQRFIAAPDFHAAADGRSPGSACRGTSHGSPQSSAKPNTSTCESCGSSVGEQDRYCKTCGNPRTTSAEPHTRCFGCGSPVKHTDRICGGCGTVFGGNIPSLQLDAGPLAGTRFLVPIGTYTVGRDQLAPHDKYLSRDHLTVRCGNGKLVLSDARAKNPTWISGQPLRREVAIQPGNTVRLGASRGQFRR